MLRRGVTSRGASTRPAATAMAMKPLLLFSGTLATPGMFLVSTLHDGRDDSGLGEPGPIDRQLIGSRETHQLRLREPT